MQSDLYVARSSRLLHVTYDSGNRYIETFLILDEAKSHYIWMNLGWQNGERVTGMTVYVRIRDGKFWIEEDWTEDGIATDLVRAGVPREDIVLAFHEPKMRQYTDFAVAS
ncbi:XisI protein [bacterium]|nr:XisI protein [bacterium]